MRLEYETTGIQESDFSVDPFMQFNLWLQVAIDAGIGEPNAMVASTVDADGQPWSRYVLLKKTDQKGFDFYTNYESHKSRQLASSPLASLTFGWLALRRQVNIAGTVAQVPSSESDDYWTNRPRGSQLGSWASEQSRPLADRLELENRYSEVDGLHPGDVPRPPHWGGWRVEPHTVEFWQGRENRLHDRLRYERRDSAAWTLTRLAP